MPAALDAVQLFVSRCLAVVPGEDERLETGKFLQVVDDDGMEFHPVVAVPLVVVAAGNGIAAVEVAVATEEVDHVGDPREALLVSSSVRNRG
jgi:hypothetical protein